MMMLFKYGQLLLSYVEENKSHISTIDKADINNKAVFEWTNVVQQKAFEENKRVMCQKTMLLFLDFSKKAFHGYTGLMQTTTS
jgi:hypothetical protein